MLKNNYKISIAGQYLFSTVILFGFILTLYYFQYSIGYRTVSLILILVLFLLPLLNFERGPIILSAIISALAWDYYFIPPHFTMHIADTEDAVMLFMFFVVALTNGVLTSRLKSQKNILGEKEKRASSLYVLIKELASAKTSEHICNILVNNILNVYGYKSVIYFPDDVAKLSREAHPCSSFQPDEMEWLAAETAFIEKRETGKFTGIVSGADAVYFPIIDNNSVLCIIGIKVEGEIKDEKQIESIRLFINESIPFFKKFIEMQVNINHSMS